MFESFAQDLRFSLRALYKRPSFTLSAVFVLALGIGLNAAIFSVVNGVLLRPLAYDEPERLVEIWPEFTFHKALFDRAMEGLAGYEGLSAYRGGTYPLAFSGEPERLPVGEVSPNHFELLGRGPFLGRTFVAADGLPGAPPVIVLSHALWQRRFGADPDVIDRPVQLDGKPVSVVGVMPADFPALDPQWRLWQPMTIDPSAPMDYYGSYGLRVFGRLEEGVTVSAATGKFRTWIDGQWRDAPDRYPEEAVKTATAMPLREAQVGHVRFRLWLLFAATGLVLLIACANVAHLLLARAASRRSEIAIRSALGADRFQVLRQLLTESTLLSLLGGLAGLFLAAWGVDILIAMLPAEGTRTGEIRLDQRVLVFTLGLSLVTAWIFGLVPALRASSVDLTSALRDCAKTSFGGRRRGLNQALVALEIAVSVVLVAGAGLLLKSLWKLEQVDPGFRHEQVTSLTVTLPQTRYSRPSERVEYFRTLIRRLAATSGVVTVGATNELPLVSGAAGEVPYVAEGATVAAAELAPVAILKYVTPGYFETLRIPVLRGRPITDRDRRGAPPVVVINRTMAEKLWSGEDPTGKEINFRYGRDRPPYTVVGVVGDVRQERLERPSEPEMFLAYDQSEAPVQMSLVIRSASTSESPGFERWREVVWSVDDQVPISDLALLEDIVFASASERRALAILLGAFSALAFLLAIVGIYGVVSWAVAERTVEIGVRMALGARRQDVVREVVHQGMWTVAIGLGIGLLMALAASRVLANLLFEVSTTDVSTFIAVALATVTAAFASTYLPARRASRVDPVVALRWE